VAEQDDYISLAEAAAILKIRPQTARHQAMTGRLQAVKIGHAWVTRPSWVAEYRATHKRRGQQQQSQQEKE
jgi:hypothetical protein